MCKISGAGYQHYKCEYLCIILNSEMITFMWSALA